MELITIWGPTREWLKPIANWSPKQGERPKCEELRLIECLILVQSWKTKEVRVVPQSTGCNKGRRPNHQSKGPWKSCVRRRAGAYSKVEAEMRAGRMQGSRGWTELCTPIVKWEADPAGRLIPEQRLNAERDTKMSLVAKSSARLQDHPHICLKSSKNYKASPRCPAQRVWCQIHHIDVTLIIEQQLRVFHRPNSQPWGSYRNPEVTMRVSQGLNCKRHLQCASLTQTFRNLLTK